MTETDKLEDFQEGQWWVKELDGMFPTATPDQKRAIAVVHNLLNVAQLNTAPPAPAYGIIDPDFGRLYSIIRKVAWDEGYAIGMHGSFTKDLDLIAVPWVPGRRCEPEHLIKRVLYYTGLQEAHSNPGIKPHGRKVWTLLLPRRDVRYVDLSVLTYLDPIPDEPKQT